MKKNYKIQGNAGIGAAIAYFSKLGNIVSIPLTDSQEYDLIADDHIRLNRIQVKTTWSITKYGIYKCALRTCGGNKSGYTCKKFNNKNCEFLFILCGNNDEYVIPSCDITTTSFICLGEKYLKYKI
jgi:hypothetical protein